MWDDLRVFLAVAREGTTLGAGRRLGLNQTTCARRIAALEETLGAQLFERHAGGYRLLPLGERLVPMAEAMEKEAKAIVEAVAGDARENAKVIRLTTADGMLELFVSPAMAAFRRQYPNVHVELMVDNRHFDIARGEADFSVRGGPAPTDPTLVARRLAPSAWAVYAGRGYIARHGAPATMSEMADHAVVGFTHGDFAFQGAVPESAIRYTGNSAQSMTQTIGADLAVGALPCSLGDRHPNLVRCFDLDVDSWIWVTYPERLRQEPHIRALSDCIAAHVATLRPMLAGVRPEPTAAEMPTD